MWPDRRLLDLLKIEHPIIQAPMAGAMDFALVAEVSGAGGLGSLPCATIGAQKIRDEVASIRGRTDKPFQLNFFTHTPATPDAARETQWRARLDAYYTDLRIDPAAPVPSSNRTPFDAALCDLVLELCPAAVSFHFGLPEPVLLRRLKDAGIVVLGCATTVAEARWLAERGVDGVVAQGYEAGGHRGMFLTEDIAAQVGTLALVPQVVDAVGVPVIAAGGITDARGIAAVFALGAAGAQVGTGYLHCPEARISAPHRAALKASESDGTVLTNVITGRPARGIINRVIREVGPLSVDAPQFPLAGGAIAPLRAKAEAAGSGDFSPMWSGQAGALGREMPAAELTRTLSAQAQALMGRLAG